MLKISKALRTCIYWTTKTLGLFRVLKASSGRGFLLIDVSFCCPPCFLGNAGAWKAVGKLPGRVPGRATWNLKIRNVISLAMETIQDLES